MSVTGACLCGAVRWAAEAPFTAMSHCHCSMCRKHHGALFATYATTSADGLRWLKGEDQIRSWIPSRPFCGTCGSTLPVTLPRQGVAYCPTGPAEGELGVRPQLHIFAASKPAWSEITDDLPQVAAYPDGVDARPVERLAVTPEPGLMLGSCLCGEMAFEADLDAAVMARNCHCSRCRRQTAAAHASNLFVRMDALRFRRGEELRTIWKLPQAERFATAFCSRCGSLAPRPIPALGLQLISMGLLDTDPGMLPACHIFVHDKAPWFEITDQLPQYEGYPPR